MNRESRSPARCVAAIALVVMVGCAGNSGDAPDDLTWHGTTTTQDGVTTVINQRGQLWRAARLVETTSIGVLDGPDEYVFADIAAMADDGERIYVLDRMAGTVRVFDAAGGHQFDIGRPGEGPGEFRRPWALGLADGDRLLVRDVPARRVSEFDASSGELLSDWPAPGAARATFTPDGHVYVYTRLRGRNDDGTFNWAMVENGPDGQGRTLEIPRAAPPRYAREDGRGLEIAMFQARSRGLSFNPVLVPFAPQQAWALAADGTLASGDATSYAFRVQRPDGTELRTGRELAPVPVHAAEADWYRDRATSFWLEIMPEFSWTAQIPDRKRAYESIQFDATGRVWVLRELEGRALDGCDPDPADLHAFMAHPCWAQPRIFDVFAPDGRFLGTIDPPTGLRRDVPLFIRQDHLLAAVEDAAGALMVKRYELQTDS